MDLRPFAPREVCAIEPRAFGMLLTKAAPLDPYIVGGVGVMSIRGPLEHHSSDWAQSYDDIVATARGLAAEGARALVLRIDSPGGTASGCLEASRGIRAAFDSLPIYAHVSGQAASAGYALACAADEITVSSMALVGSVGVIDALVDLTGADAKQGVGYHVLTSGARKADGYPHAKVGDETIAARQALVDEFARLFFEFVAERRGMSAGDVEALEAGVFAGASAVAAGLADRVEDYSEFFARIVAGDQPATATAAAEEGAATMAAEDREDALASLRKLAESEDEKVAARAKKALRAMEEDEDEAPEKEPEEAKSKAKASATDEAEAESEEKEPEANASASILTLSAKVLQLEAEIRKRAEEEQRQALLASRPDLPPETVAHLRTIPVADAAAFVASLPKMPSRMEALGAASTIAGTRGNTQATESEVRIDPRLSEQMDRVMRPNRGERVVRRIGDRIVFGARKEG